MDEGWKVLGAHSAEKEAGEAAPSLEGAGTANPLDLENSTEGESGTPPNAGADNRRDETQH